ncbi:immunity repressor [Mycobacterium phage MiniMac]|nr:immunity repressor [Mycobacterium phage MiniMac]
MRLSGKSDTLSGMSAKNDQDNDLLVVVSYLLRRQVRMQEALSALGMSRSTYYEQRDKGVLNSVPNLMLIADAFGLNKVDLLVRFGHLDEQELVDYLADAGVVDVEGGEDYEQPHPPTVTRRAVRSRRRRVRARLDSPPM